MKQTVGVLSENLPQPKDAIPTEFFPSKLWFIKQILILQKCTIFCMCMFAYTKIVGIETNKKFATAII